MSILVRRCKGRFYLTGTARLGLIVFLTTLAISFVGTIWAVYLESFLGSPAKVGFFSAVITLFSFFSYFYITPLVEKSSKSRLFSYSLFLMAVCYLLFAINKKFYILILLVFIVTLITAIKITSLGIIIKDKAPPKKLSRNEGLMYTFFNISWLVGPLIAGYISQKYGFNIIFLLSAIITLISLFYFRISRIQDANTTKKIDGNLWNNFFAFFNNKERVIAYVLGGGVNLWLIFIYLFVPLFIINSGLGDVWIGYFLFAVAIPTISFEYFFSKIACKTGFKKMFNVGFLILSSLSLICFFIGNIYLILGILAVAGVGVAMIESTTESYFLDLLKTKKDELRFYGPYNTSIDANHFIGEFISAVILVFLPFKFLFVLFGIFMFVLFLISTRIRDVVEDKKIVKCRTAGA